MAANLTTPPEGAYWLASMPKSGNTWVRMFVNAYITGHCDINRPMVTQSDIQVPEYQRLSCQPLNALNPMEALFLRHAFLLNAIKQKTKGAPVIFKTHNARLKILDIELVPKALIKGAVYLVRDPRAVAVSYAKHMDCDIDTAIYKLNHPFTYLSGQTTVGHYTSTWSENVDSWSQDDVTVVKYEDLLENPEREFTRILEAYQIKLDKKKLSKAIKMTAKDKLAEQEKQHKFRECINHTFFYGTPAWKETLTDSQCQQIELHHGEWMHKLNYLESKDGNTKLRAVPQLCTATGSGHA